MTDYIVTVEIRVEGNDAEDALENAKQEVKTPEDKYDVSEVIKNTE